MENKCLLCLHYLLFISVFEGFSDKMIFAALFFHLSKLRQSAYVGALEISCSGCRRAEKCINA